MGLVYCMGFGWSVRLVCIVIAGFIGNIADSVLGATIERTGSVGNDMVNFINTAVGAGVCVFIDAALNCRYFNSLFSLSKSLTLQHLR